MDEIEASVDRRMSIEKIVGDRLPKVCFQLFFP
jgi:hypothetical protein